MKHILFGNLKKRLAFLLWWMGGQVFFTFLILLFLAIIIASIVLYGYVLSARNTDIRINIAEIQFNEKIFQEVLGAWEDRAEKFEKAGKVPARNIFIPQVD